MEVENRSPQACSLENKPAAKAGRPKSTEKRIFILDSAADQFLQNGFSSTSMDMVAKQAGVSKQTVYSHFKNKDALFTAVVNKKCRDYQMDAENMADPTMSARAVLVAVGFQFVKLILDPEVISMYRLVIGEVVSNPHIAELFYQAGPQQATDILSQFMQNNEELQLPGDKAHYWSTTFFNLLKGDFHMRTMLGLADLLDEAEHQNEVEKFVDHLLLLIRAE